jgi:DNA-binding winged helix-turn-helix (wHTH) protein
MAPVPFSGGSPSYSFGAFRYDSKNRQLTRGESVLRTTPKALQVLEVLLQAQGNLVTLDELTTAVWHDVYVDRTTIHQNVATLRRLLEDDPKAPVFIETVPRLGYRFVHPVQLNLPAQAPLRRPSQTLRRTAGIAAAATILLFGLLMQSIGRPSLPQPKPAAQAQYELGRQYWNQRLYDVQAQAAREAFRTAIQLDPSFALAHVGLADTYLFESDQTALAAREIQTALTLNPNLGEAYASLGFLRMFHHHDWNGAEEAFLKSQKLSPAYATGHQWRGTLLLVRGRLAEARDEYRRASSLDLLSVPIAADIAAVSYYEGNFRAAQSELRQVLVRAPAFVFAQRYLLRSLLLDSNLADGVAVAIQYSDMYGVPMFDLNTVTHNPPGSAEFWKGLCRSINPYEQAVCWGIAGNTDRALEQLEKAVHDGTRLLMYVAVEPAFRKLHDNSRFHAVLRACNLTGAMPR